MTSKMGIANKDFPKVTPPVLLTKPLDKYEEINRLIIIGNGFDIAHGLKSSFKDFINDYCLKATKTILLELKYNDPLISMSANNTSFSDAEKVIANLTSKNAFEQFQSLSNHTAIKLTWNSAFFKSLITEVEKKKWVDIEIQYFDHLKQMSKQSPQRDAINKLNSKFEYIKLRFIEYLKEEVTRNEFTPNHSLVKQFRQEIKSIETRPSSIRNNKKSSKTCILNFNYTNIVESYAPLLDNRSYDYIPIHGQLDGDDISSQAPIFGFGDEIDEEYVKFERLRNDELFKHIKSFKYLQFRHYRNLMAFIESNPYQVQIFGHSCGLSDRTLLNTIFEHENCISIKPFYYSFNGVDDYEEKSYAIARHFKSKSELRNKVVNKEYCEAMVQPLSVTSA